MKYISKSDEDLIRMIHVVSKFPEREASVLRQLFSHFTANPDNAEAAFAYGFFKYLTTTRMIIESDLMGTDILQVLDIFDQALQVEPKYWLVRCFKLFLYRDLPAGAMDPDQARKDFSAVIRLQDEADRQEPYFIMPYIIYADYLFTINQRLKSLQILRQGGKSTVERNISVTSVSEYFHRVVSQFYNKLVFSNDVELVTELTILGKTYFPGEIYFQNN